MTTASSLNALTYIFEFLLLKPPSIASIKAWISAGGLLEIKIGCVANVSLLGESSACKG
jgi:hypothetical protein